MSNLAIYQPFGKAAEYAAWACNLFTGCSNDCSYCYCKKGFLGSIWTPEPLLKKCFQNEEHAYVVFIKELGQNIDALRRDGLFFSFTTDPFLHGTREFTWKCILAATDKGIPVSVLTKRADFIDVLHVEDLARKDTLAFGFTLTGCDELEPNASPNAERLDAMQRLHEMGFRTFASLEPVIDPRKTARIVTALVETRCCDLIKIGLESGRKEPYNRCEVKRLNTILKYCMVPVYRKHSFTSFLRRPHDVPIDIFRRSNP